MFLHMGQMILHFRPGLHCVMSQTLFQQVFDKDVCNNTVHNARERPDKNNDRTDNQHSLDPLDEKPVCKKKLGCIVEQCTNNTESDRTEELSASA